MKSSRNKRSFHAPIEVKVDELLPLREDGDGDVVLTVHTSEGLKTPRIKGLSHKNSIWKLLGRAYQKIGRGKARNKYLDALRWLAKYLVNLDGAYPTLKDIDSNFFHGYAAFLRHSKLSLTTRYNYYSDAGTIIKRADELSGLNVERAIPMANHGVSPPPPVKASKLSSVDIVRIAKAALSECSNTMHNYTTARLILALKSKITPPNKKAHFQRTLSETLLYVKRRFDLMFNSQRAFTGNKNLRPLFFPTPRTAAPFIILTSIYTAFNPDTVKQLKFSDITTVGNKSKDNALGSTMLIRANKNRASAPQTVSFPINEDISNPYMLLEFQKIWRSAVESLIADENQDFCFLYVPSGRKEVKPFIGEAVCALAIRNFVRDHDLPYFQLDDLRQAMLDMGGHLFGGNLLALQKIAGHLSIATTHKNYSSTALVALNDEKFAVYLTARERWMDTMGKVDPRDLSGQAEILSATPGFLCLAPYDSPVPGEHSGRLCRAYGACPDCPLSGVRTDSPYNYLRLLQLKKLIDEAKTELSPSRWLSVWRSRLEALDRWLACFSPNVIERARNLVEPGPLPPLE